MEITDSQSEAELRPSQIHVNRVFLGQSVKWPKISSPLIGSGKRKATTQSINGSILGAATTCAAVGASVAPSVGSDRPITPSMDEKLGSAVSPSSTLFDASSTSTLRIRMAL